jgi:ABC-2 type transport system ATP-binding protein
LTGNTALECYGNLSNVPTSVIRRKRGDLLALVGLADRAKDRVKKYSKGMLQRLGLAQSLLHDPKLLILDEPTDGLDPRARADMRSIIKRLQQQGVTIFLNSHILHEVEMICDRVAILDRGDLRYCGTVNDVGDFVKALVGDVISGTIVHVEVSGNPAEITEAFAGTPFEIKSTDGQSRLVVRANMNGQTEIDALVDRLRARDISLIRLEKEQVSLEDAFLKIVEDKDENQKR